MKFQFLFQCIKEQKRPIHCVQRGAQLDKVAVVPSTLKAV